MRLIYRLDKNSIFSLLKSKKARLPLILFAIGILLLILPMAFNSEKDAALSQSLDEYKEILEEELSDLCSDVDGVGKCRVFVTLERGEQSVYKGSSLVETKPPKVLGVTVICRGAESDRVKSELVEMITALFDIGSNRVSVISR